MFSRSLQSLGVVMLSALVTGSLTLDVAAQDDQLQVATTILPISQFTLAVAGERANVTPLLPTTVGPHAYQARPADAQALSEADVLVINGLEIEEFLDGLIENAGNPDLTIIDTSEGIATIESDGHGHDHHDEEKHGHDHGEEDHDHDHDHGEEDHGHDHSHSHGEFDPHVWLDPKRAIQQVENIRDGLIAADPEGRDIYTANAAAYIENLQALDTEVTDLLEPYTGKTFVVFHNFTAYFADSYGLKGEFLVEAPEANASPDDVRRVMTEVQESGLNTILTEPQAGDRNPFQTIAQDLGIQVSVFDPLEVGPAEALDPDYYLTIMRQNVKNLSEAFGLEAAKGPNLESVEVVSR